MMTRWEQIRESWYAQAVAVAMALILMLSGVLGSWSCTPTATVQPGAVDVDAKTDVKAKGIGNDETNSTSNTSPQHAQAGGDIYQTVIGSIGGSGWPLAVASIALCGFLIWERHKRKQADRRTEIQTRALESLGLAGKQAGYDQAERYRKGHGLKLIHRYLRQTDRTTSRKPKRPRSD